MDKTQNKHASIYNNMEFAISRRVYLQKNVVDYIYYAIASYKR